MTGGPPPASFLRGLAVFGGFNPKQLGKLRDLLEERHYAPGDLVCEEGRTVGEMYVVVAGEAEVLTRNAQGEPRLVRRVGPSESIGEMALLDAQPRAATIQAASSLELYVITWDALLRLYRWDLKTYTMFVMNLARQVARRLRAADRTIAEFGHE